MGRKSTGFNSMVLKWAGSPQVPILPGPKGLGAQAFQSHGLEMGRKSTGSNPMVLKWAGSPQVPILQYFQIHRSYKSAWSLSISRFTGPQNAWSFSISRFTGRKSSFEILKYTFFEICSEIRGSGPSHSIRLVKSVSKNSARAQINSKF